MSCHTMLPEKAHYAPSVAGEDEGAGVLQGIGGTRRGSGERRSHPKHVGMHSLQIAAAKTLAAGGEVPDRTIQSEGRWKDGSSTFMIYSGGNTKDSKLLPSTFARIEEREEGLGHR